MREAVHPLPEPIGLFIILENQKSKCWSKDSKMYSYRQQEARHSIQKDSPAKAHKRLRNGEFGTGNMSIQLAGNGKISDDCVYEITQRFNVLPKFTYWNCSLIPTLSWNKHIKCNAIRGEEFPWFPCGKKNWLSEWSNFTKVKLDSRRQSFVLLILG